MSVKERREREKQAMREAILDAARAIIKEEGAGSIEIREIAKRIEYSPSVIYAYFKGRDAIVTELFIEGVDRFWSYLRAAVQDESEPLTRLKKLGQAYLRFGRENPELYQIVFSKPIPGYTLPQDALDKHNEQFQFLVDVIQECIESGAFHRNDARAMAYVTWATVHGLVSLEIMGRCPPDAGDYIEKLALQNLVASWRV